MSEWTKEMQVAAESLLQSTGDFEGPEHGLLRFALFEIRRLRDENKVLQAALQPSPERAREEYEAAMRGEVWLDQRIRTAKLDGAQAMQEKCAELADLLTRSGATPRNGWHVGLGIADAIRALNPEDVL